MLTDRGGLKWDWVWLCYPELGMTRDEIQAYINTTPKSERRDVLRTTTTAKENIRKRALLTVRTIQSLITGVFESPLYAGMTPEPSPLAVWLHTRSTAGGPHFIYL